MSHTHATSSCRAQLTVNNGQWTIDNLKKASDIFITESDDLPQVMAEEATSVGGVPEPSVIADFNVSFFFFTVILI